MPKSGLLDRSLAPKNPKPKRPLLNSPLIPPPMVDPAHQRQRRVKLLTKTQNPLKTTHPIHDPNLRLNRFFAQLQTRIDHIETKKIYRLVHSGES